MTHTSARVWQWVGIILILGLFGGAYWYFEVKAGLKTNTGSTQPQGTGSLASGLAGYWPLDNGSGTSATDASTNGNTGTLTNGPTWTTGQIGSAVDFDGTDDYITAGDQASLEINSSSLSIGGWFKIDAYPSGNRMFLITKGGTSGDYEYELNVNGSISNKLKFSVFNTSTSEYIGVASVTVPTIGTWFHVLAVWDKDATATRMYYNGVLEGTSSSTSGPIHTTRTSHFNIGRRADSAETELNGMADEVRVYSRALSGDEVAQLYRLTSPTGVDTSLKGYWGFNGGDVSGTTAFDRSGAGNNGTLTNGPVAGKGKVGQALSFDGTDDYTVVADANSLDITGAISLSTWVKTTDTDGCILSKSNSTPDGCFSSPGTKVYELGILSSTLWFQIGNGTSAATVSGSASSILDNNWHYITATWDGTTGTNGLKLYIDGVLTYQATSAVSTIQSVSTEFLFAGKNGPYDYAGLIDETRLYNRALSAAEIKGLYDVGESDKVNSSVSQAQGTGRLDSGLAGYWKMDDGSGTSATDSSTNGITGTLTNGPTWTTGQIGGAVDLDGTDDWINFGATHNYTSQDFSISHWAKFDSLTTDTGGQGPVTIYKGAYQVNGYYAQVSTVGVVSFLTNQSGANQTSSTPTGTIVAGNWYHMTYVRKGASVRIYINGVDSTSTVATHINPSSSSDNLYFGKYSTGNIEMNGQVDELRVYDRVLSADEVAQLYRLTAPTGVDTSLKGYWSFNAPDMASTTAYDRSGVGNTGTLTNSPTKASGIVGQAVDFDGTNDYVSLTDGAQFDPGGTASWCLWFYNDTALASSTALFMHDAASSRSASTYKWIAAYLTSNSTNLSTYVRIGGTAYNAVGPTLATGYYTNAWHHVCSTFDKSLSSARLKIYIDGTLSGTADAANGDIDAGGFPEIGRWEQGTGYFNGKIDEVRMYNRALTAGEIKSQYDAATPDKGNSSVSQPQGTGRLDSGLAGYWKLDDGSGTSATDSSTNGITGTLTNGPTWTTGQIGGAVNFDGTDDYIDLGDLPVTESAPALTWSLWVNPANFSAGLRSLIAKFNNDNTQTSWMVETGNANAAGLIVAIPTTTTDGSTYGEVTTAVLTVSTWNLVTVVFDGTQTGNSNRLKIYVNGVQMLVTYTGTIPSTTQATTSNARIAAKSNLTGYFPGLVDEVRLYNRALSNDEISQLYRLTAPTGTDTSLKGYWSFNGKDISGTTAFDRSGVGNNGTLTNSPTKAVGKIGQGLAFTASTNVVSTTTSTTTGFGTGDFSYGAWVKTTGYSNQGSSVNTIIARGYLAQAAGFGIGFTSANTPVCYVSNDGTTSGGTALNDGQWHFVMLVRRSNVVECWQNGVKLTDGATTSNITSSESLNFGNDSAGPNNRGLVGKLDEVRLYNRALSASEITALYNSSR